MKKLLLISGLLATTLCIKANVYLEDTKFVLDQMNQPSFVQVDDEAFALCVLSKLIIRCQNGGEHKARLKPYLQDIEGRSLVNCHNVQHYMYQALCKSVLSKKQADKIPAESAHRLEDSVRKIALHNNASTK